MTTTSERAIMLRLRFHLRSAYRVARLGTVTRAELDEIQCELGRALIAVADLSAALQPIQLLDVFAPAGEGPGVRGP